MSGKSIRERVIEELLLTERAYIRSLNTLTEIYIEPLQQAMRHKQSRCTPDIKILFATVSDILSAAQAFERALSENLDANSQTAVSDAVPLLTASLSPVYFINSFFF